MDKVELSTGGRRCVVENMIAIAHSADALPVMEDWLLIRVASHPLPCHINKASQRRLTTPQAVICFPLQKRAEEAGGHRFPPHDFRTLFLICWMPVVDMVTGPYTVIFLRNHVFLTISVRGQKRAWLIGAKISLSRCIVGVSMYIYGLYWAIDLLVLKTLITTIDELTFYCDVRCHHDTCRNYVKPTPFLSTVSEFSSIFELIGQPATATNSYQFTSFRSQTTRFFSLRRFIFLLLSLRNQADLLWWRYSSKSRSLRSPVCRNLLLLIRLQ